MLLLKTLLLTIGVIALFFGLLSLRLIFLKGGEFKGTCASQSPFLNKDGEDCSFCGKPVSSCPNKDEKEIGLQALPNIKS